MRVNPAFSYAEETPVFKEIYDLLYAGKGILIIGSIGSGKTYLMEFFAAFMASMQKGFRVVPSAWIIRDCINNPALISGYGRESFAAGDIKRPITICFDDLGMEPGESKIYGNSVSIMTEILIDRYIMQQRFGMKTHATSNLTIDELQEKYGDRSASRFRSMFNILVMDGKDRRK